MDTVLGGLYTFQLGRFSDKKVFPSKANFFLTKANSGTNSCLTFIQTLMENRSFKSAIIKLINMSLKDFTKIVILKCAEKI